MKDRKMKKIDDRSVPKEMKNSATVEVSEEVQFEIFEAITTVKNPIKEEP